MNKGLKYMIKTKQPVNKGLKYMILMIKINFRKEYVKTNKGFIIYDVNYRIKVHEKNI